MLGKIGEGFKSLGKIIKDVILLPITTTINGINFLIEKMAELGITAPKQFKDATVDFFTEKELTRAEKFQKATEDASSEIKN